MLRATYTMAMATHRSAGHATEHEEAAPALADVEHALARLDTVDYGYCVDCGVRIPTRRLIKEPQIKYCLPCAGDRVRRRRRQQGTELM